jgi:hypothetical protein
MQFLCHEMLQTCSIALNDLNRRTQWRVKHPFDRLPEFLNPELKRQEAVATLLVLSPA